MLTLRSAVRLSGEEMILGMLNLLHSSARSIRQEGLINLFVAECIL